MMSAASWPSSRPQLHLRGFDASGQPTSTSEAVRGLLDGLGADPATLPVELDALAARYRGLVAGKRMLVVLDNARDADQVVPLLPGSPTCTVLVTSRRHLAGLTTAYGARLLDLGVLPEHDARDLLARHLGPQRLAAEPVAVAELLEVCAGLPLAVRIVAARAAHHPTFPLSVLAGELRDASARLDGFDAGNPHANLRAVLSWSLSALSDEAATLFRLLGIAPGPDIGLSAAVSLAGLPIARTRSVLRELETASLVTQHVPGRYRMHDLVRLYAADIVSTPGEAMRRVVDFYLHTAAAAERLLDPHGTPVSLGPPAPDCHPEALPDATAALTWFDAERRCLLAAQQVAGDRPEVVVNMAWVMVTFHRRRGHRRDLLTTWQAALTAA